jgi:hypothetical protein
VTVAPTIGAKEALAALSGPEGPVSSQRVMGEQSDLPGVRCDRSK